MTWHKYSAKPTVVDGIRFASKLEAGRYGELKLLEKAGEISMLSLQPAYELFVDNANYPVDGGRTIALGKYIADFKYVRKIADGSLLVIEDVKGFDVPLQRWKRKHAEAQYGITVNLYPPKRRQSDTAKGKKKGTRK